MELQRLDSVHEAFSEYFGGRLSFAPLEDETPKAILEMGCGGGAWAIDAAKRFPESTVCAVDANPLPARELPQNVHFQKLDLRDPFPFEDASFDVVHTRLVLFHIPNAEQVLKRAYKLIKPSGWLIIEEPDETDSADGGRGLGAHSDLVAKFHDIMRSHGAEPCIGRELQGMLESSGCFSEVNIKKVEMPLCGQPGESPSATSLGMAWRQSHLDIAGSLPARFSSQGITEDMVQRFREAVADPSRALLGCVYFAWAKRKAE
ncbi:hypothetical protein ACEPAG_5799 [Sanghuangporus baumii]